MTLEEDAKELLIDEGYDEKYGARPLRRSIERFLEDPLAEAVLGGQVHEGDNVLVIRDGNELKFTKAADSETEEVPSESEK